MTLRIRETSSSDRSLTRVFALTSAAERMRLEAGRPIPKMYVKPISTRLLRGRSTPAIRAILSLPLFVLRIFADHPQHALAADRLAFCANLLDGCPDFHVALTCTGRCCL